MPRHRVGARPRDAAAARSCRRLPRQRRPFEVIPNRRRSASPRTATSSSPRSRARSSSTTASSDADPDTVRRSADRGLRPRRSGPARPRASTRNSRRPPLRLRPLHLRPHPRRRRPPATLGRGGHQEGDPVRRTQRRRHLPGQRPPLATDRRTQTVGRGRRETAGRRLVPAVLLALGRRPRSSAPTGRSTRAAATAPASTLPTTASSGRPPNPCGDPPEEGGALRAQDLRTGGRSRSVSTGP